MPTRLLSVATLGVTLVLTGCGAAPTAQPASSASSASSTSSPSSTSSFLSTAPTPSRPASSSTPASAVTVTFAGGTATDPRDGGRPVVLIAAALGVPTDVFREAFSHVTPARGGEPEPAQVQRNKAALLDTLAPYGIDNDELDRVSNHYRYNGAAGERWSARPATATATVVDGRVTGVTIVDGGAGYSSAPVVTITGGDLDGSVHATATVAYGTDLATNGRIESVAIS